MGKFFSFSFVIRHHLAEQYFLVPAPHFAILSICKYLLLLLSLLKLEPINDPWLFLLTDFQYSASNRNELKTREKLSKVSEVWLIDSNDSNEIQWRKKGKNGKKGKKIPKILWKKVKNSEWYEMPLKKTPRKKIDCSSL